MPASMSAAQLSAILASASSESSRPVQVASAAPASAPVGFRPAVGGPGIQVGAFSSHAQAQAAAESARSQAGGLLSVTRSVVSPVTRGDGSILYRAWLVGLSADHAGTACDTLSRQGLACMVVPPDRMA